MNEHDAPAKSATPITSHARRAAVLPLLIALAVGSVLGYFSAEIVRKRVVFNASPEAAAQAYAFEQLQKEQAVAEGYNTAVSYGIWGAATGLLAGLGAAIAVGQPNRAPIGALAGLVLGGLAGALPSIPLGSYYFSQIKQTKPEDLTQIVMVYAAIMGAVGLACGIAAALATRSLASSAGVTIAGLVGGVIGAVLAQIVVAVFFSYEITAHEPISESAVLRFVPKLIAALVIGVALTIGLRSRAGRPAQPHSA